MAFKGEVFAIDRRVSTLGDLPATGPTAPFRTRFIDISVKNCINESYMRCRAVKSAY
jgi:hypothetical protein